MVESVWDYPRPPVLEYSDRQVQVVFGGQTIADSTQTVRVLETSQPPVYYIPPCDVATGNLREASLLPTLCEFKGLATYWNIVVGKMFKENAAWTYEVPTERYASISGYFAFYAGGGVDCFVDGVLVRPQLSSYYGGWITPEIKGPFKCIPGTKDSDWKI